MSAVMKFYILVSALLIVVSIAVLGFEGFGFLKISNLQGNLAEQQYRMTKLDEKKENLQILESRFKEIEEDLPKINTALPDKKESSKLISDLDALAGQSGLKLTLVQSTTYGKKSVSVTDPSLLQTVKGKYGYELPLEIKVEGTYGNFINYVKRMESYQRLVNINSVEIRKIDETGMPADQIEAKLRITAYLKK